MQKPKVAQVSEITYFLEIYKILKFFNIMVHISHHTRSLLPRNIALSIICYNARNIENRSMIFSPPTDFILAISIKV